MSKRLRSRRFTLIVACCIAVSVLGCLVACRGNKDNRLGVVLSLTGPGAQYGQMVLDGVQLAVDEMNARPGLPKWRIVVEDDATDPRVGLNAVQKLIEVDKVRGLVGPIASSVALTVVPIAERNKIVMMSPAASTPLLTGAGRFVFRIYPSDTYDGAFLADVAHRRFGLGTAAILYLNNDFGSGLQSSFSNKFEALGGKVVGRDTFNQGATSFRTQLIKLKQLKPDALFLIATVNEYIVALRQMQELGFRTRILAPLSFDDPSILQQTGSASNGVLYSRPAFDTSSNNPSVAAFVKSFRAKKGKDPSILNALGFDATLIMIETLEKNPSGGDGMPTALRQTVFEGATGTIRFDANGDVMKDMQLMEVQGGRASPLN